MGSARTRLVVGNWKAGPPRAEAQHLAHQLVPAVQPLINSGLDIVICPPFPWLTDIADIVKESGILVGAQTLAAVDTGDITGEVPASLLCGICEYALIGHYERRIQCGERDGDIRKQIAAALAADIRPIFCVGEPAEALEHGASRVVVAEQLEAVLEGLILDTRLVIAYAPVWTTIGMVIPPAAAYVNDVCGAIRETLADITSVDLAAEARIIYGGRLTESGVAALAMQPEIDGLLIGAGATSPERFAFFSHAIVSSA
ncbi:MAG: triose-phosphate isomerase family protein [Chloroflexota bacterium]